MAARSIPKMVKMPLSRTARSLLGTITRVETTEPVLALTFDDGPHPKYTPSLLDILDKFQAKATFFCVGKFAEKNPDVIRRAAEAGHIVGNHTWSHASLPLLTRTQRRAQIDKCAEALKPYGSRLFRPPFGHQSLASRLAPLQKGYHVIGWSLDSGDWRLRDAPLIVEQILPEIRPGYLILFHDRIAATSQSPTHFNREPMLQAVNLLLQKLKGIYRFVTVPALFGSGHVVRVNWYRKANLSRIARLIEESQVVAH